MPIFHTSLVGTSSVKQYTGFSELEIDSTRTQVRVKTLILQTLYPLGSILSLKMSLN